MAISIADHDLKVQYIKHRGFDDDHYKKMIIEYPKTYKAASRKEFNRLLLEKLPDILDTNQKSNKIANLLLSLRKDGIITNTGSDRKPRWMLVTPPETG